MRRCSGVPAPLRHARHRPGPDIVHALQVCGALRCSHLQRPGESIVIPSPCVPVPAPRAFQKPLLAPAGRLSICTLDCDHSRAVSLIATGQPTWHLSGTAGPAGTRTEAECGAVSDASDLPAGVVCSVPHHRGRHLRVAHRTGLLRWMHAATCACRCAEPFACHRRLA